MSHPRLENCYISRLTVRGVGEEDVGRYLVSVTNIHGTDTAPLHLTVRGKLEITLCDNDNDKLEITLCDNDNDKIEIILCDNDNDNLRSQLQSP